MRNLNSVSQLFFILLILFNYGCRKSVETIPTIDIENNINNMEVLNMSDFIRDIKYIPLENVEGIFLTAFSDFDVSDKLIFKTDGKTCLLFDTSGKLISKFGKSGRGPNEYSHVAFLNLWGDNKVYFKCVRDLFEYNTDGSFINKYINAFLIDGKFYITEFYPLNDSLFIGHIPNSTGKMEYKALIFNKYGQPKHTYKNYISFNFAKQQIGFDMTAFFQRFKNEVYYKAANNDTLFYLDDNLQLIPDYIFNLGRYKHLVSESETSGDQDNSLKYINLYEVLHTENHLLLMCDFRENFPAKRFTPNKRIAPTSKWAMYNTTLCLGIYDKNKKTLVFCKPTDTDNPLFTTGLYNDIDGGPRFFPMKRHVNDSTMIMWLDSKQLKDHIASDDFKKK